MRICFYVLSFLVVALASPSGWSDGEVWRLEKDKDGIQVYTRAVEGWSIREFKGVTRIRAALSSLVAVIDDISASHELTDVVSEAQIEHRESDTRYQVYSAMKMPWPIADRDILNQREIVQDGNSLAVTITDVAIEDPSPHRKGLVHILKSHSQWLLVPTPDGSILVEMQTLSDPAGIPASIINVMSVNTPFVTLSKLREMAQRAQYVHAKLPFIEDAAVQ